MRRIFVDANVLVELLLGQTASAKARTLLETPETELYMSALTVHLLYYFAEREQIDRARAAGLASVAAQVPLGPETVRSAQGRYDGHDFEDCLQAACAEAAGCDQIVTLDKNFAKYSHTKLPVRVL